MNRSRAVFSNDELTTTSDGHSPGGNVSYFMRFPSFFLIFVAVGSCFLVGTNS